MWLRGSRVAHHTGHSGNARPACHVGRGPGAECWPPFSCSASPAPWALTTSGALEQQDMMARPSPPSRRLQRRGRGGLVGGGAQDSVGQLLKSWRRVPPSCLAWREPGSRCPSPGPLKVRAPWELSLGRGGGRTGSGQCRDHHVLQGGGSELPDSFTPRGDPTEELDFSCTMWVLKITWKV